MSEEKSKPDIEKAASEVVFDTLSSLNESMARIARGQQLLPPSVSAPSTDAVQRELQGLRVAIDNLWVAIEDVNDRVDALAREQAQHE